MNKNYRMLSFVERFAIAPRHHHQDVANHSFFVTLYCSELCEILNIAKVDRIRVLDAALRHDAREAWESDVPGPAKRSLFDPEKRRAYAEQFSNEMNWLYKTSMLDLEQGVVTGRYDGGGLVKAKIKDIIKVADLIDEAFFLAFEQNLGNNLIKGLYRREMNRLDEAAIVLGGEQFAEALMTMIGNEIGRIAEEGAVIPVNNSDIVREDTTLFVLPGLEPGEPATGAEGA